MVLVPLLQLFFSINQATNFLGTVMTYDPETNSDGIFTVALRFKTNFQTCSAYIPWECRTGDCTTVFLASHTVSNESSGEWCHREGLMILQITGNDPFQLWLNGRAWKSNINGIVSVRALTLVDPRTRSDTGKVNRSPQTTMLPVLRVPSNCPRQIRLLAFDPDGDNVQCRYGNQSQFECNPCTPPPVLTLSSSCDLSFSATNSSAEGLYAVQLVMEDSPGQPITLARGGVVTPITTATPISKIPVQFAFKVDPAVPSCTDGLYLPGFQSPTPANRAQLQASVNQVLQISIKAVAANSAISELLFSGPHNINQTRSGAGDFTLSWTPSVSQSGENHPICFVVQAVSGSNRYHSELRCVIVIVANGERRLPRAVEVSLNITNATTTPTTSPTTVAVTTAVSQPSTVTTTTPTTTPALTPPTTWRQYPNPVLSLRLPALTPPTTVVVTTTVSQPSTFLQLHPDYSSTDSTPVWYDSDYSSTDSTHNHGGNYSSIQYCHYNYTHDYSSTDSTHNHGGNYSSIPTQYFPSNYTHDYSSTDSTHNRGGNFSSIPTQ
uniref:mucin-5AC-like n=1 Tax=Solea senegalensis TaxID=28829 RepID=UPI001CD8F92F|nr:mucin-5AC-like [Solea senegalensis]